MTVAVNILQGSAVTQSVLGGLIVHHLFLQISYRVNVPQIYENWLTFVKVTSIDIWAL